jgi:hypothetical protein
MAQLNEHLDCSAGVVVSAAYGNRSASGTTSDAKLLSGSKDFVVVAIHRDGHSQHLAGPINRQ